MQVAGKPATPHASRIHSITSLAPDVTDLGFQAVGPALRILQINIEGLSASDRDIIASLAKQFRGRCPGQWPWRLCLTHSTEREESSCRRLWLNDRGSKTTWGSSAARLHFQHYWLTLTRLVLSHAVTRVTLAIITESCSSGVALMTVSRTRCSIQDIRTLINTSNLHHNH